MLRRLHQQLLLPRCVKAWALAAATAAAAWEQKEVGGPRIAGDMRVKSPVNMLPAQNPIFKGQVASAQMPRGTLVKGQAADHAGWFSGGAASPPTEAAGATQCPSYPQCFSLYWPYLLPALIPPFTCSFFVETIYRPSFLLRRLGILRCRPHVCPSSHASSCNINQPRSVPKKRLQCVNRDRATHSASAFPRSK